MLLDQTEIYCQSHTDSIVLLQKHGSNHRNAIDSVGKIDLDFIIHPAAEIFRTKEDFKWGLFLSLSGQIYKWRQGSSIGVPDLIKKKPIGDQFIKQTTYIIMAMFDYSLKFLDVS